MRKEHWCIVGGGMLGLSLAHQLADGSRDITVLDGSDRFGGLADAWQIGSVTWDRFYHVTLLSDSNLRRLLTDIGLQDELNWSTTQTNFYTDGQFYPLNNVFDYLKFPPLGMIDKMRLAATILYASRIKNGTRLESIPVAQWLTRLSGTTVYQRLWQPLLRAKLGENHKHASASFIWSVINRFYAARRAGLKDELFGYVSGGYDRIIETLIADLQRRGVHCLPAQQVESILSEEGAGLTVTTPEGVKHFDRVIATTAGPITARLCPGLSAEESSRLTDARYQGVVCASVLLKQPLNNAYLTYIADESVPFTGIIEMSAVVDRSVFDGHTLVYLPRYVPSDDPLFERTDAELQEDCHHHLLRLYPHLSRDDIVAVRIARARNVLALQSLNYSQKAPPMDTSVPGLYIVNSAQIINGNLNVDETIGLALDAAERLQQQTNSASDPIPAPLNRAA